MEVYYIKKGRDIRLEGAATKELENAALPAVAAVQPTDFKGIAPRLSVKVNDVVSVGSPLFSDKTIPEIQVASPVSGKVVAINRGEKRKLLSIVVESDGKQKCEKFQKIKEGQIKDLSKDEIVRLLLDGRLWSVIRQRPFSKVANPKDNPKAIFVHAMNTEPLAADIDFVLQGKEKEFQVGVEVLRHLTRGSVHVCVQKDATSSAFSDVKHAKVHYFSGAHPAGNVSTHIHTIDPINKGDMVWYVEAQDVVRIAQLLLNGEYPTDRVVAITGPLAKKRLYVKTIVGAKISSLLKGQIDKKARVISGSILTGTNVGHGGFLCSYDSQITLISEGGKREFLGWLKPGSNKYTFSKTFLSALLPEKPVALDTDKHGSDRAIVLNNIYDRYISLDILTNFLLRAIMIEDIEEAEKLGILECDEEDFALATFVCPSKVDVGDIIRKGLDLIEKEG